MAYLGSAWVFIEALNFSNGKYNCDSRLFQGDYDKAIAYLEKQIQTRDGGVQWQLIIKVIPVDAIRNDPRYQKMLNEILY